MKIFLTDQSIIATSVDVIVNPANPQLLRGGGLSGIVHKAAGEGLFTYLKQWKYDNKVLALRHGETIISPAFDLSHKYIIHAVGAIWKNGSDDELDVLRKCYTNCLTLAEDHQLESIAFPAISTGIYGFPKEDAAHIAVEVIRSYNYKQLKRIVFSCYDKENYRVYEKLSQSLSIIPKPKG